ncbi:TonB-dependent receptor [Shewanella aestuarii]|uniref:TonB-dependent receptor n=1 Tax=Shewanella aestuarii TaxID=1028752 RepID=A0A6G9QPD8_9GAMM|nr:TonB-dependent receptor [Shewanella aestuarii]
MKANISLLSAALLTSFYSVTSWAGDIEVIQVNGSQANSSGELMVSPNVIYPIADIGQVLNHLPGASVNGNGPLTGIAQYRGLSGERVNTQVNGASLAGAGPNAMDAPLSYASLILTEWVEAQRGIAPVASGVDTLGGSINVVESQARFQETSGKLRAQYLHNGERSTLGGKANLGGEQHALLLYADVLHGDDNVKAGDGREISPTFYDKQVFGGQYRFNLGDDELSDESIAVSYQHLKTKDAGTPALPMDIDYIKTDRVSVAGSHQVVGWALDWHLAYSDARHGMDNLSSRTLMPTMSSRYNTADSQSLDSQFVLSKGDWRVGYDGQFRQHNSVITSPDNPMFRVDNFNHVQDDKLSVFAQWQHELGLWQLTAGTRLKYYHVDSAKVDHSMAANMPAIAALMQRFNDADRNISQTGIDAVFNARYQWREPLTWVFGAARKQAGATYQQRYLWVPMQSTGGLADGRTYVGNPDLDLETAYQLELGLDYQTGNFSLSPRAFYHRIDDYIQGVAATDPTVIMAAKMMGDDNPLMFANVDAELYGMDLTAAYQLTPHFSLDLIANYIRGQRRDVEDNLYRIAPPKLKLGLNYVRNQWRARLESVAVSSQDNISAGQLEKTTAGYALLNISLGYQATTWQVDVGVNNVFDTYYKDHLAGYNRVIASALNPGERMPGEGISAWLTAEYHF